MKKRPLLEGVFEPNFSKFQTWNRIFFQLKRWRHKTRKFRTFIYRELHISKFSARSENLFWSKKSQISNLKSDFLPIKKVTSQNSKISHIHLSWTSSEQIFSKIREPFFITKINKFRTWNRIFFQKKGDVTKLENCAHSFILNFIWKKIKQDQRTF